MTLHTDLTSTVWAKSVAAHAKKIVADLKDYPQRDLALDSFVMSVNRQMKTLQRAWGHFLADRHAVGATRSAKKPPRNAAAGG
jgi:hypothetical protein